MIPLTKAHLEVIEVTEQLKIDRLELLDNIYNLLRVMNGKELAEKLGISPTALSRIKGAKTIPGGKTLAKELEKTRELLKTL